MTRKKAENGSLLGPNALAGLQLGISVSESPDLQRLGLLEIHFRVALGELARTILVSGGELNYGGHLDASGYTAFLIHELRRYSRRDRPFHSILAWQEHRKLTTEQIHSQITDLGLYGDLTGLDVEGCVMDMFADRPAEAVPETDQGVIRKSLTSMRRYLMERSNGRVIIGGKRAGFHGELPGIIEEALLALEANQPVYFEGGFGGATADITRILGIDGGVWIPDDADQPEQDQRWKKGLDLLDKHVKKSGRTGLDNGLTDTENRTLAVSHRPSEIAALVSLGMGRRFVIKADS